MAHGGQQIGITYSFWVVAAGLHFGARTFRTGERSSHCPLCPLKQRSAERARMSAKGHLRTLPGFILEVEIVPQRRKITVYHWLQSCQRDVPKSPYRGSDDARGGRA